MGELRTRIIRTVLFLVAASAVSYWLGGIILNDMFNRMPGPHELVFLSPQEAFFSRIKLALAGGVVLSVPFLLFQIVRFFSPMLSVRDRRAAFALIPAATLLFLLGGGFGYMVMLPFALGFLLSFGGADLEPMLSVSSYINFVILLVLPLGIVFQLPIVITFFTRIGILDPRALARRRKYAVLLIFIVAALLTPADVFSMFLMVVPLLILFELSLLVAKLAAPRKRGG